MAMLQSTLSSSLLIARKHSYSLQRVANTFSIKKKGGEGWNGKNNNYVIIPQSLPSLMEYMPTQWTLTVYLGSLARFGDVLDISAKVCTVVLTDVFQDRIHLGISFYVLCPHSIAKHFVLMVMFSGCLIDSYSCFSSHLKA